MFKSYNAPNTEWCFITKNYNNEGIYLSGNQSLSNIIGRNLKFVADSHNDCLKHRYYTHTFNQDKDKPWVDFFLGDYKDGA